ncbi:hypothetical protein [Pedobacter cryoconitis]|uniref:Uncharacterized protein n=1 Tax=Pedobacter cryoconitis TaxID=188932 RepID=A0A7X0ML95_9SPHI|nr:hypothetical protein [Pedobacter cryoconitis]MBB6502861.1 hypothetical protein [Pedobacter cryoconitis]
MKSTRFLPSIIAFILVATTAYGQTPAPVNYLNVKSPIVFNSASYSLSWSSHPAANFYKQEYLTKGDNSDRYKSMLLTDLIIGEVTIQDLVRKKVLELKKAKETNPIINYQLLEKDGEPMLDFMLSASSADGKTVTIIERNIYRYQTITGKNGQKAVLLFGISTRAYGDDIINFMTNLKTKRMDLLNKFGQYKFPGITLPGK